MRRLIISLGLTACLASPSAASTGEERRALVGDGPGSLANPRPLRDLASVAAVCEALAARGDPDDDEAPPAAYRAAARAVYRASVPATGFFLATVGDLSVALDRPLAALGGALDLSVLDRDEAAFDVTPKARAAILAAKRAKRLRLDVVFRLEGRDADLSPCRAYKGTYVLRAEPLRYALVEGDEALATRETKRLGALERLVSPGEAQVRVIVSARSGTRDPRGAQQKLRTDALQACLQKVVESPAGTGMVALEATVDGRGRLTSVDTQLESFEDDTRARCIAQAIGAVSLGRGGAGRLAIEVAVERGAE